MNLFNLFKREKIVRRPQYEPIFRVCEVTRRSLAKEFMDQHPTFLTRFEDNISVLSYVEFEVSILCYSTLTRLLEKYEQNELVQSELREGFDHFHKRNYSNRYSNLNDPLPFIYERLKQYSKLYKQTWGGIRTKAHVIEAVLEYKNTGYIAIAPASPIHCLDTQQLGTIVKYIRRGSHEVEEDDAERETVRLIIYTPMFEFHEIFEKSIEALLQSCPDLMKITESETLQYMKTALSAP